MAEPQSMKDLCALFNFEVPEDFVQCSDLEIHKFLVNKQRVKGYLDEFLLAMSAFVLFFEDADRPRFSSNDDQWGEITALDRSIDPNFFMIVHVVTIYLTSLGFLTPRDDAGQVLDYFFSHGEDVPDPGEKGASVLFFFRCLIGEKVAFEFPMVRRLALSLWSVILCRRPTVAFSFQSGALEVVSSYTGFVSKLSKALQEQLCSGYNDNIDIDIRRHSEHKGTRVMRQ